MKEIQTKSTSTYTAECSPIVLRQTDRVRLAFLPTLVSNPSDSRACVRGQFLYQKKLKNDQWVSVADASLSGLKSGEGYKLDLHSAELHKLLTELADLYRLYRQRGIPRGRTTFVKLEAGLARFLTLGEAELTLFLESHRDDAETILLKLLRWLTSSQNASDIASRFAEMAPERLPSLTAIVGLAAVKDALRYWKQNATDSREEFWQQCLADRTYVLSQIFAHPVVIIKSKAYVGGKQIDNQSGNVVDFLASVESTNAVLLIEIKTPQTPLLAKEYRNGAFPLSFDLSGAVAQTLKYRQTLMREFNSVSSGRSDKLTLGEPRCVVVAGRADQDLATPAMRESFELQRDRIHGLTIITYDELFTRLERLVELIEGASPAPPPF
ncbi:MAG TPA: Shedu immune nuclease family protein [Candidatus Acidoferrales bacterium]|nr:Shedu immune nuclease family protein [Candidatus Acidoferrales bacterium]